MARPDIKKLQVLYEELRQLREDDLYTREQFERLYPQFLEAADGQWGVLDFFYDHTPEAWLEEAFREPVATQTKSKPNNLNPAAKNCGVHFGGATQHSYVVAARLSEKENSRR